jgi:hypothetical protein
MIAESNPMSDTLIVELVLAYVAGLLTIPAMFVIFVLLTDGTPSDKGTASNVR